MKTKQPNIILIITDQQSATMLSCAGNRFLQTPAMDSLAASGIRFERAYCTNPVCVPSRFSIMTGHRPDECGLRSDNTANSVPVPEDIKQNSAGWVLRRAGYETAYGGKVHLPEMSVDDIGFDCISSDERDGLANACADFIKQERQKPFFLVASFVNPHDICYMALRDFAEPEVKKHLEQHRKTELATLDKALLIPQGTTRKEFFSNYCPPLPANFEPQENEPEAIRMLQAQRPFKKMAREQYSNERWRMHRWAYCRLTEMVDAQIGKICEAIREKGNRENTIIIFTSDHGDMDSAHRMEHKTAFYNEACRIPLIISCPSQTEVPGTVNYTHLISNGLDILPTICDYAATATPAGLTGISLRPLAEGRATARRTALPLKSEFGQMIVTDKYKYMLYDQGENREQLIDLNNDPGEMRNSANDPDKADILHQHRKIFAEIF